MVEQVFRIRACVLLRTQISFAIRRSNYSLFAESTTRVSAQQMYNFTLRYRRFDFVRCHHPLLVCVVESQSSRISFSVRRFPGQMGDRGRSRGQTLSMEAANCNVNRRKEYFKARDTVGGSAGAAKMQTFQDALRMLYQQCLLLWFMHACFQCNEKMRKWPL